MLGVDARAARSCRGSRRSSSSQGATTTCSTDGASRRASSRIASIGCSRPRRLETRRRDRDLRLGVLQPLGDRRRGEAGEDRHLHRADVGACVRGDRDLGRHRQVDRDAVAGLDAEPDERLGELRDLARELGERERAPRAVLAQADRRDVVGVRSGRPAVDAVPGDVELPADEPGRPLGAVARGRRPATTARRTRCPCPRPRPARTTRARRPSARRAPGSRRSRASA